MKILKISITKWTWVFLAFCGHTIKPALVLDESFGVHGSVQIASGEEKKHITAFALQPDNAIIVLGTMIGRGSYLSCYNQNGSLNTAFGYNEREFLPDYADSLLIQPSNGKIIVGLKNRRLVRYDKNGGIDLYFGLLYQGVRALNTPNELALQPHDNKLISLGVDLSKKSLGPHLSKETPTTLGRLDLMGEPDRTFGSNGIVKISPPYANLNSIAVRSDNSKILVTGRINLGDRVTIKDTPFIASYNSNGSTDKTFGPMHDGKILMTHVEGQLTTSAITLPSDDHKIIVYGIVEIRSRMRPFIARFHENGTPDATFGPDGTGVIYPAITANYYLNIVTFKDHKIIACGKDEFENTILAHYNPDGSLDTTSSPNGLTIIDRNPMSTIQSIKLSHDERSLIIGFSIGHNYFLTRYKILSTEEVELRRLVAEEEQRLAALAAEEAAQVAADTEAIMNIGVEKKQCVICLEESVIHDLQETMCRHSFHPACMTTWRQTGPSYEARNSCPTCRTAFPDQQ